MTTSPMIITFVILLFVILFFIQGKYRPDFISVASLLALTVLGVLTPEEALSGFSNSIVLMIAGLFIVGAGIFDTGLASKISKMLLRLGGNNESRLLFIIMITVSLFGTVLSNTGTVAILIPVVMSIAVQLNINPSKFLIPLTYSSSLGGLLTLIGTTSTLVVSDALVHEGYPALGFFTITGIGFIALLAGMLYLLTFGRKLLPKKQTNLIAANDGFSPGELAGIYKVYDHLHFIYVPQSSDIVGERIVDLSLAGQYGITVVEIERKVKEKLPLLNNTQTIVAKAGDVIYPEDLLLIFGEYEQVQLFSDKYELEVKQFSLNEMKEHFLNKTFGMTEILLTPHSSLENRTLADIHFRKRYDCNVLAIKRKGQYIQSGLSMERLKQGDALLVHGQWENIEMLALDKKDLVVLGTVSKDADLAFAKGKAPIAGAIMLFMLALMIFDIFTPVISVLIAAFLMVVTGCIRTFEGSYQRISWEVIVVIATMLPMAIALEKTGGMQFISNIILELFGGFGPYGVLIAFFILTTVFSQFISNTATAVIFAPIAITTAVSLGSSPYPFVMAVAMAAGMSFSTPIATPANVLVMNAGGLQFKDFARIGVPMQIFIGIIVLIALPILFPF
ncbi:SLC13 family permease [Bacillus sp. AGMB 02131]|uniref:SLC13 family permease n=1 Tax=Peribacillus faecalis TaxID=2772559 RepID=A0A927H9W3_9BACI|nr:SLC13 family permease [Peribacillus faecalis]MBD3106912.1 SLC13 family permease [Peribacillus faecalis]